MLTLNKALPYLVLDLESALAHLGRGKVAQQLRVVAIERWTYDEDADAVYLHLRPPGTVGAEPAPRRPGETVSVFDELGVNLDTDGEGRLTGMEIFGGEPILAQLRSSAAA